MTRQILSRTMLNCFTPSTNVCSLYVLFVATTYAALANKNLSTVNLIIWFDNKITAVSRFWSKKKQFRRYGACIIFSMLLTPYARADCFDDAATWQHLNPWVLRAIAWQESRNNANALHENLNGSTDYGLMQINSIHLKELAPYGIHRDVLMSPCKNVFIAAWHLRKLVVRYGNTWKAVGSYHSETPALRDDYARNISLIIERWRHDGAHSVPDYRASLPPK